MPNIQEQVPLAGYSTFKIGGPARYFCTTKDEEEARGALDFAISKRLKVFVIGRGSNLLISDQGFEGLVIQLENASVRSQAMQEGIEIEAGAALPLMKLLLHLQDEGCTGLEWAAGIPATVGGAIANNAGANGKDIGKAVRTVRTLEIRLSPQGYLENYASRKLSREECGFSYRKSIFKESKSFLILEAKLLLSAGESEKVREEITRNLESRRQKQPLEYPNIGSIFKNPLLSQEQQDKLAQKCPNFSRILREDSVPAGWLIENAGMKGKRVGGVMVSEKHANFIVNTGGGRSEEVIILISLIKERVRVLFGVQLHEEIEYVGF